MNERIRELMKKAGGHMKAGEFRGFFLPPPPDYIDPETVDLKKFAGLIVRECVGIARQNNNSGEGGVIAQTIEQHFGVE